MGLKSVRCVVWFGLILAGCCGLAGQTGWPTRWLLNSTASIGGHRPTVLGAPKMLPEGGMEFNGANDGLILPVNPIAGLKEFTVEVLFRPDDGGQAEQRFLHIQDEGNQRGLLEIRMNPEGRWSLDTFLFADDANNCVLLDRAKRHPAGQWAWVALVYDGKKMASFVNGVKELEGEVSFPPMTKGQISLGVRLNQVSWFKGVIREVRFYPRALEASALQSVAGKS